MFLWTKNRSKNLKFFATDSLLFIFSLKLIWQPRGLKLILFFIKLNELKKFGKLWNSPLNPLNGVIFLWTEDRSKMLFSSFATNSLKFKKGLLIAFYRCQVFVNGESTENLKFSSFATDSIFKIGLFKAL